MTFTITIADDIAATLAAYASSAREVVSDPKTGTQSFQSKYPNGLLDFIEDCLGAAFEETLLSLTPPPELAERLARKAQLEKDIRAIIRPSVQAV